MGESSHIPNWKIPFGSIDKIQDFTQNGKSYLQKFSELFYWCFKMSQVIRKTPQNETLAKNFIKRLSDCRKFMKYYLLGSVFFMDINPRLTLESLNRINNLLLEIKDSNLLITSGFVHIFLGYVSEKVGRTVSSQVAFNSAIQIFPHSTIYQKSAEQQMNGNRTFKEWVADSIAYFELQDGNLLTDLVRAADSIDRENFQTQYLKMNQEISTQEYEKKFLEQYSAKKKAITHVRRCSGCNYFMVAEGKDKIKCPQCQKPMDFALYCPSCGIWYTVKTPKKYMCPTCGNLMIKKEKV